MKFDVGLPPSSLHQVASMARQAEATGFDALWTNETQHDPFLPLALAAQHTQRIRLGTAVAIGFARSPTTLAYTAWDLAEASGGRFILGIGTQVKAHIERRFGMPWPESPVGKLREMIACLRALWDSWQNGEPLQFRGKYFRLTLMTPFFNPGPIKHPDIPLFIAGVNPGLCRLAGEVAQGFHAHPLHSERYLREVVRPTLARGAAKAGRDPGQIQLSVTAITASDETEASFARMQLAFYASTPSYRPTLALHGWGDLADQLRSLARRGGWSEMPDLISNEVLRTFAVVAPQEELADALKARYSGLADRLTLYRPFSEDPGDTFWGRLVSNLRG
jgi:probable F420-dependent oxidoreductase